MKQKVSMNKFSITNDFTKYKEVFLQENASINLISKNDEKYLYEKHIYDSLAIKIFFEKYKIKKADLLDIGCGGGFPSVPIAIECPEINVYGIDSIQKKISSVDRMKSTLHLNNLHLICARVETLQNKSFDVVTSRAVADLSKILTYGLPLLKKNGYFVAYKSKKAAEELDNAKNILQHYNAKVIDIIPYKLPLNEVYERNLIVISF